VRVTQHREGIVSSRVAIDREQARKALLISLLALAIPVVATGLAPRWTGGELELLVWILPLVPAFLLSFHHGWKGASVALSAGMAVLAFSQALLAWSGAIGPPTQFTLGFILVLLVVSLGSGWVAATLRRLLERARDEAHTDHGTGLPNRRAATAFLEKAFYAAQRGYRLSVVIFDLDHFKSINDKKGHAAGDEVLSVFGETLVKITRAMNLSARFGGEEFISIVNDSDADGAAIFADRVRTAFEKASPVPGATVSAGVAEYEPGMASPDVLVAAADQALYRAKSNGRNRVEIRDRVGRRASGTPADAPATTSRLPAASPTRSSGQGQRVLVVDDDPAARSAIARGLQRFGYAVVQAGSASDAMQIMRQNGHAVDLVVTDIVMPDTGGFRLMEMIRELHPSARAVYVSGYDQNEVDWAGVPGAAWRFITKPIQLDDLGRTVAEVLQQPVGNGASGNARRGEREESGVDRLLRPIFSELDPTLWDDRIMVLQGASTSVPSTLVGSLNRSGFRNVAHARGMSALPEGAEWDLLVADLTTVADRAERLIALCEGRTCPLLLISADASEETRLGWMSHGIVEVLRRPVDGLTVAATARNLLRIRRLVART
jgi:diguanylate cyclase (GGDEF)-like protein